MTTEPTNKSNTRIPPRVYGRVAIQAVFVLFMLWYFSFRIGELFVLPIIASFRQMFHVYPSDVVILFAGSFCFASLALIPLVKRGIRDEMQKKDEPFYFVAKDPDIELVPVSMSNKEVLVRVAVAGVVSQLFLFPLTLIGAVQVATGEWSLATVVGLFFDKYWMLYSIAFMICTGVALSLPYVIQRWHWTKKQF